MTFYTVRVARAETIEFRIEADDERDAQERYLMEGEEVYSRTDRLEILSVIPDQEQT